MATTRPNKNISDFKSKLIGGGARPNLFEVELTTLPDGVTGWDADSFQFLCKAAALPAQTIASIDVPFDGGEITLQLPDGNWPGSEYHPLFGSHWEILVHIEREGDGPLLFVEPIIMDHDDSLCDIPVMPILSGRSEYDES